MYLTLSKRFEFSSSLRQFVPTWDDTRNQAAFGPKRLGQYGHGYNIVAVIIFSGPIDPATGMVINVTDIKREVTPILDDRYDHKFLNLDSPAFRNIVPTPEMVARTLLGDVAAAFGGHSAKPVACHVQESPETSATAYANGTIERHFSVEFSAARRTCSPNLTDDENKALFGAASAPGGHGHGYRLRVTISGPPDGESGLIVPEETSSRNLRAVKDDFDHKNLNVDRPELAGLPMTTEILAQHLHDRLRKDLPAVRVRLHENTWFFAEYGENFGHAMGVAGHFHAAHRLDSESLSAVQNREIYGKCNNPNGHGHRYEVEATIGGQLDERSGTLYALDRAVEAVGGVTAAWDRIHLNRDRAEFRTTPSTGENIISILWPEMQAALDGRLTRLRLWETPNNRFAVRSQPPV
jgi:6-pyruvoyltetrahydropterin/6-carboxytetrahydropterin synthase